MEKLRKILSPALGILALTGAILRIMRIDDFNTLLTYLYLAGGLLLLLVEITGRVRRKLIFRILLVVIPVLMVLLAVQNLLSNTFSFTAIVISIVMYYMLSERYVLDPEKS